MTDRAALPRSTAPLPPTSSGDARRHMPDEVGDAAKVSPEQSALLARLSQEVAALRSALDASRHRIAKLEVEAAEDPVSGLLNQRAFRREVEKAVEFNGRYRTATALALLSADGMNLVAERHGPRVANRLLRTMGDRLRGSIRSCDVAARLDPYRFGIVLWNAAAPDCAHRLDVVRAALGGMDRLLEGRVAAIRIRAVATCIEAGDGAEELIARAEALLAEEGRPAGRAVRR